MPPSPFFFVVFSGHESLWFCRCHRGFIWRMSSLLVMKYSAIFFSFCLQRKKAKSCTFSARALWVFFCAAFPMISCAPCADNRWALNQTLFLCLNAFFTTKIPWKEEWIMKILGSVHYLISHYADSKGPPPYISYTPVASRL